MSTENLAASRDVKPNATYGEIRRSTDGLMEWEKHRGPEYWQYRRKWVEYPKNFHVSEFPLNLDIETTNVCNLDCVMCPRTIQVARKSFGAIGYMDFGFYRRLIDQGAGKGLAAIKMNYLGEPLLHPDVAKQIRYAKEAGVIDTMFNTNATMLTEEKSHEILEAGLDNIFFSVDSPYKEKFNAIRIGADYDKVVSNIVRFIEIKNKRGFRHVQTRVSMTVMNNNFPELVDFKNFWLEYVDVAGFGLYHDIDGIDSPYNPSFSCSQPFQRMFVMWDGVCTPCCIDSKREFIMGNAKTTPLQEIWRGPTYQYMREVQMTGRYKEVGICNKCYVPYTALDGTVVNFDDVEKEAKAAVDKQNQHFYDSENLELPDRALKRKETSSTSFPV